MVVLVGICEVEVALEVPVLSALLVVVDADEVVVLTTEVLELEILMTMP